MGSIVSDTDASAAGGEQVAAEIERLSTLLRRWERRTTVETCVLVLALGFSCVFASLSVRTVLRMLKAPNAAEDLAAGASLLLAEALPPAREELAAYLAANAELYGARLVGAMLEHALPALEQRLAVTLDRCVEHSVRTLAGATVHRLRAEIADGRRSADTASTTSADAAARAVAGRVGELLAARTGEILDHFVLGSLGGVPGLLQRFETVDTALSRKEAAQRRALLSWCALSAQPGWEKEARPRLLSRLRERLKKQYGPPQSPTR